ncbi:lectin-like domain-containing protein, partial [Lactobacillus helveticus]|uniref:lectin-like domain-containing protein n=1 Tax=Lactobacillus helveticus TaxID=1587 RepID=UPI0020B6A4FF
MKRTIAHKRLVVGEKKQRFGFRKTIFGLCGAILGSTLLMVNAANNANTVHADEYDPGQATSGQSDDSSAKGNGANTDAGKASVKTPVEVKGNEGTNTDTNTDDSKTSAKTPVEAKGNDSTNTDAGKASVKTPVEVKGNEGTNTDTNTDDSKTSAKTPVEAKGNESTNTDAGKASAKTPVEVKGNEGTNTDTNTDDSKTSAKTPVEAKGNESTNTDAGKASAKTPVEVKGNEGTNTANGLNGKAVQPLAKKEVPKLNSSLKQDEKASKATHIRIRRALPTDKEALIHVTKDNFLDYFSLDGSATYDKNTGIVTITPDEYSKVGNLSLKSKIDMNTSFTLTGKVNLGSNPNGADGIGFAFHTGNTTDIGNAGGNLGIGGLQNALGFKLDTWSNGYQAPLSDKDGSQIDSTNSDDFGWNGDSMNAPYGTFVDTKNEEVFTKDGKKVQRWWAKDVAGTSQALSTADVNGQFHDFTVDYDGDTRKLTIKYTPTHGKILTWITTIPNSNQPMAMIISSSTGGAKNLHQFEMMSFDFKQAATVNVKYVDTKGNQIAKGKVTYPNGADVNGTYTTGQLKIPNYKFVRMDDGTATGAKSLPATGTLTEAGDNGTVIYVYTPNQEVANVTYIDDKTGKTLSTKDLTG